MQAAEAGRTGAEGQGGPGGPGSESSVAPGSGGASRIAQAQNAPGPGGDVVSTARRPGNRLHILYPTCGNCGELGAVCGAGGWGVVGCRGMDDGSG